MLSSTTVVEDLMESALWSPSPASPAQLPLVAPIKMRVAKKKKNPLPAILSASSQKKSIGAMSSFASSKKKASKARLTHWTVPHGRDYLLEYCSACHFDDCERCSFCLQSKLSTVKRFNLDRFAKIALQIDPHVSGRELADAISKYARLDDVAREFNDQQHGWCVENTFCPTHQNAMDEFHARLRELENTLDERRRNLDEERRKLAQECAEKDLLELKLETEKETTKKSAVGSKFRQAFSTTLVKRNQELEEEVARLRASVNQTNETKEFASTGVQISTSSFFGGNSDEDGYNGTHNAIETQTDEEDDVDTLQAKLAAAEATMSRMIQDYKQLQRRHNTLRRKSTLLRRESVVQQKKNAEGGSGETDQMEDALAQLCVQHEQNALQKEDADESASDSSSSSSGSDDEESDDEESLVDIGTQTIESFPSSSHAGRGSHSAAYYKSRLEIARKKSVCAGTGGGGPLAKYSSVSADHQQVANVEATLGILGGILERKALADASSESKGKLAQPLANHVIDYMSDKFGIKAMAKKRVNEFLAACRNHAESSVRIGNFAKMIGLYPGKELSYARDIGDVVCAVLRSLIAEPKAISETFSRRPPGQFFVSCQKVVAGLVGDDGVVLSEPTTYDCRLLSEWLPAADIKRMLQQICSLKTGVGGKPVNGGTHLGIISDPIDLDAVQTIVAQHLMAAVDKQVINLCRAFDLFSVKNGTRGLDYKEFEWLLEWAVGHAEYTKKERKLAFQDLVKYGGDDEDYEETVIKSAENFALGVMLKGGPLSQPAKTRRFWKLPWTTEEEEEDEEED